VYVYLRGCVCACVRACACACACVFVCVCVCMCVCRRDGTISDRVPIASRPQPIEGCVAARVAGCDFRRLAECVAG